MIAFKEFKIAEGLHAMNEFMKTHPPLPTKEGMGITFQGEYAVVWYEDGFFPEKEMYISSIEFAINDAKSNLVGKHIALATAEKELDSLISKEKLKEILDGHSSGSTLITYFRKSDVQGRQLTPLQAEKMAKLVEELDQKRWMSMKEIHRVETLMIPQLEKLLEKYK